MTDNKSIKPIFMGAQNQRLPKYYKIVGGY